MVEEGKTNQGWAGWREGGRAGTHRLDSHPWSTFCPASGGILRQSWAPALPSRADSSSTWSTEEGLGNGMWHEWAEKEGPELQADEGVACAEG